MPKSPAHRWEFKARFRRHAFGWRGSRIAVTRVRQAVSEIRKVSRKERVEAAEGAIQFLEKVSPALEQVDSSSGAIGSAVNGAIATLVPIIAAAPVDTERRGGWLERLWQAYQDDGIPYIESLGDHWGELCASPEMASRWADELIGTCRTAWSPGPDLRGFFKGTTNCLSALLAAGRHEEILDLLKLAPYNMWAYREFGVKALVAMGDTSGAIRYAEELGLNDRPLAVARACEEILLAEGRADEAYRKYGLMANQTTSYLAWFRAVARKYPHKTSTEILDDLIELTPGDEGKWFAAAKDARLLDTAIALANRSPTSPQTLTRAARDHAGTNPDFALEAGMAALRWLLDGYGYEITGLDVLSAHDFTMKAARAADRTEETRRRIRDLMASGGSRGDFVSRILEPRIRSS